MVCDRTNKIEWLSAGKPFKTKYGFTKRFSTELNVEDLKFGEIQFLLTGNGGETLSQKFKLI